MNQKIDSDQTDQRDPFRERYLKKIIHIREREIRQITKRSD